MKKSSLLGACLLALAVTLGCGASYAKTPPDQLIVGMNMNNLLTLDPAAMTGNEVVGVVVNLYDSLVELDPEQLTNVRPALAKSWEISPDGATLTFHLHDNVTFHSGNPLTAADVVWSMRRILHLNLAQASVWKSYGFSKSNIDKQVTALDDVTVQITLPKANDPQLVLYSLGALGNLGVIDSKMVQSHAQDNDWGNRWLTTHEAGSGPFMLETWQAKEVLRMQRNPNYWRGEAKMSRVVLRHFQESQTLRLMIEKGDLDIANNMAVSDINALRSKPQLSVDAVQRGTMYYVAMSMKEAHFANPKVREALRYPGKKSGAVQFQQAVAFRHAHGPDHARNVTYIHQGCAAGQHVSHRALRPVGRIFQPYGRLPFIGGGHAQASLRGHGVKQTPAA